MATTTVEKDAALQHTGWMILIHPDFLWHTALAKTIKHYAYFDYTINEALYLSEKYEPGFEHPQLFSKLFKAKTNFLRWNSAQLLIKLQSRRSLPCCQ